MSAGIPERLEPLLGTTPAEALDVARVLSVALDVVLEATANGELAASGYRALSALQQAVIDVAHDRTNRGAS